MMTTGHRFDGNNGADTLRPDDRADGTAQTRNSDNVVRLTADNIIEKHVIVAMGAALVPLPLIFDMAAVIGIQVNMIASMARAYKFPVPQKLVVWKVLASVVGGVGPAYLSLRFADLIKGLPLLGQAVYISALSISGGASVYAVGKLFQEHFESGGTFLSKDNPTVRRFFKAKHKEGLKLVPIMMKRAKEPAEFPTSA